MQDSITILEPDWGIDFGRPPQFEIRYVEVRGEDLYVLGIAHTAIKLGDSFRFLEKFEPHDIPQDTLGSPLTRLRLRVDSISAYHNQINRINAEMNAGLLLSGDWQNLLAILEAEGWTCIDEACHQWRESVRDVDKLMLSR